MKISYNWLQDYFEETLPTPEKIGELLTMHSFEVESIEDKGTDTLLDIKVLPDRSHDCLSHRGIALEVSIHANLRIKEEKDRNKSIDAPESNVLKVEVLEQGLCKRFSSLVIENIEVKESPAWLKERLSTIGQRSINNIVDATNYVMFALGQPLHAYDRNLLSESGEGWQIVVRKAKEVEHFTALGNKEYKLTPDTLVVADGVSGSVLGIAGIKGGKASEITKDTKHIILESANFESVNIRKTAKRLGIRTDASVRFENEITPELTTWSLKMVADLIRDIAGTGETRIEGIVDIYPRKANLFKAGVSLSQISEVLGITISQKDVEKILLDRGFTFAYIYPQELIVKSAPQYIGVPYKHGASVLFDAPNYFDCSSFTAFLCAQVGVSIPRMSVDQMVFGDAIEEKDLLPGDLVFSNSDNGKIFYESIEWQKGTIVEEGVDHVGLYMGDGLVIHATRKTGVVVEEKISKSESFKKVVGYRRVLSAEPRFVVTVPVERLDLRIKEDLIEEIGRIYGYENVHAKPITPWSYPVLIEKNQYYTDMLRSFFVGAGYSEVITYAFRCSGEVELANPIASDKAFLRSNLTFGISEALTLNTHNVDLLGLSNVHIFEIGNVFTKGGEYTAVAFAGGKSDEVIQKLKNLGVEPHFKEHEGVFEANLSDSLATLPEVHDYVSHEELVDTKFQAYSPYPVVLRDIAVFIPEGQDKQGIIQVVKAEAKGLLANYMLFDTFTKSFPEGKKTSYAYRLVFQSMNKTLSDEEIHPIIERATQILNEKDGWQVR